MKESRRNFLKVTGSAIVGAVWATPLVKALTENRRTIPGPEGLRAKRWALAIDTNKCSDPGVQNACAEACHSTHNVPRVADSRHEIKWIWAEDLVHVFPTQVHGAMNEELKRKRVLVLCNHCERPPCVRVCPTKATFKRSDGIVMMDMHRCIGCRYCMAACPYGARSFNFEDPVRYLGQAGSSFPHRSKGVVEKCTFCADRLAMGLQPACVEAANKMAGPGAMVFGDVADSGSEISRLLRERRTLVRKPVLGTQPHVYYVL